MDEFKIGDIVNVNYCGRHTLGLVYKTEAVWMHRYSHLIFSDPAWRPALTMGYGLFHNNWLSHYAGDYEPYWEERIHYNYQQGLFDNLTYVELLDRVRKHEFTAKS